MNKSMLVVDVVLLFLCCTAHATVWYVHHYSVQNCIQDCLDSCSTNDTVLAGAGTVYENIVWPTTEGIVLMSECGGDTTIIDGSRSEQIRISLLNKVGQYASTQHRRMLNFHPQPFIGRSHSADR